MLDRDPSTQLQIGDVVLYTPEGVVTRVVGYQWVESAGSLPSISAYVLDCGVAVPGDAIRPHDTSQLRRALAPVRNPTKQFRL